MPIYEYQCNICDHKFEEIKPVKKYDLPSLCPRCSGVSERIPSNFTCVTDTNFFYTGKYDSRLGSYVEGRKDFWNKAKAKGLHEIPTKDFATTTTLEERVAKLPNPIE